MSKSDCNDLITKTCNTRDECCHGLLACNYNQFLCASNITMTCRGLRCEAELENRVCCPLNSRVCSVLNYCYIYTIQICLSLFSSVVSQEGDSKQLNHSINTRIFKIFMKGPLAVKIMFDRRPDVVLNADYESPHMTFT